MRATALDASMAFRVASGIIAYLGINSARLLPSAGPVIGGIRAVDLCNAFCGVSSPGPSYGAYLPCPMGVGMMLAICTVESGNEKPVR